MNDVMRVIKDENLTVLEQQFDNACTMTVEMRKMQVNAFVQKMEKIEGAQIAYLRTL